MVTRTLVRTLIVTLALVLWAIPAEAQEEHLEKMEKKIHALRRQAKELEEMGEAEIAAKLRAKAEKLKAELKAHLHRHEKDHDLEKIIGGLEHGMVALKKLGKHAELEMLERVANEVRKKRKALKEHAPHGEEHEAALQRIAIMKTGVHALLEAERKDSAELLEHAIHARELELEGRRDDKAMKIRKTAPELGAQVEFLNYAGDLWDEFGHETKAAKLRWLAKEMTARHREVRKVKVSGSAGPRIDELQRKIVELEAQIAEYREALRSMKK